jgi:thiamine-phosphate pyrophosphorylase
MTPKRPVLCLITDRRRPSSPDIVAQARAAADAGIDLFQIREPDLPDGVLFDLTRRVIDATAGSALRVLVNDRLDVALAAGAHGVHLRGTSFPASRARTLASSSSSASFLIGRSVHSVDEAVAAEAAGGLDYLILGTIFPTISKPAEHRLAGVDTLRAATQACRLPVLAIGGVTLDNADQIVSAGAAGLAAIWLFANTRDLCAIVTRLGHIFGA